MGMAAGPRFTKRPPDGWVPARVFAEDWKVWDGELHTTGVMRNEVSSDEAMVFEGTWRVEVAGREPYRFAEKRWTPLWVSSQGAPTGKRWYTVRLKPQSGFIPRLGFPCFVNPAEPTEVFIDWDAGWAEHVPVWEQEAAVKKEVDKRRGGIDGALSKVFNNPMARSITPEEEALVAEAQAREAARNEEIRQQGLAQAAAMGFAPVSSDEAAEQERLRLEAERIYATGREVSAVVISNEPSGRTLANVPTYLITFDLDDGGTRRQVELDYVWGPRAAKRYRVGRSFPVRIDPGDPSKITPAK